MAAAEYTKDLALPPVFGGSGTGSIMPPSARKQDVVPPTFNGPTPGSISPSQRDLELPPMISGGA